MSPVMPTIQPVVIILGAGFSGLELAKKLFYEKFQVILIDRKNYHTFQPLLHQVATAELEASQITYPIRSAIRNAPNVKFVWAEVLNINPDQGWVETTAGRFVYDFLVIATGSRPKTSVPGSAQHTWVLKTIDDAIAIHDHILRCFETAFNLPASMEQGQLAIAIVGGGTTGVELAGAMAEWIHRSLVKDYHQIHCQQIRILLLHSGDNLLPGFHPSLQRYALKHLKSLGVEVYLKTRVDYVNADGVMCIDGKKVLARTVLWTTGVQRNVPPLWVTPSLQSSLGESDKASVKELWEGDRLPVLPTLQLAQYPNIYAVGDVAALPCPAPMLASVAVQQGRHVAQNLYRQTHRQPLLPFQYRSPGTMAILGRHAAVVQLGKHCLVGFPAWLLWLAVHIVLLRGRRHRLLTLFHWSLSYIFRERIGQVILHSPSSTVPKDSI